MIRSALGALALVPCLYAPALAAPVAAKADYVLSVGGINVARMSIDLTDDGKTYGLDLTANVAGLGSLVASGTAKASASGRSNGRDLVSTAFSLETRARGETFTSIVEFADRAVTAFKVEPPVLDTYDRVPLERRQLRGVGDFLSAFVLKGELNDALCQKKLNIFTGVERFNITMRYLEDDEATSQRTGYQGPVVVCSLDYEPISGHFTSSEMTSYLADTSRILIWYAPLGESGYAIPYRVLVGTDMGDLSMVLTAMSAE